MLYGQLLTSIDQKFCRDDGRAYGSLGAWAEKTPVILDDRPFSFHKHEYLMTPYADNHPHVVEIKAAQMGLTTKAMLRAMHSARYRNFRGILYLFPQPLAQAIRVILDQGGDPALGEFGDIGPAWEKIENAPEIAVSGRVHRS